MKRQHCKSILSAALALILCLGLLPVSAFAAGSLDHFKRVEDYPAGKFTDVASSAWYAGSVETAYELDLVKGSSGTTFTPSGSITLGSVLALACRLHSIYNTGTSDFVQGDPWYQVYVDYAAKNGIITQGQYTNYNAPATRRQCAGILGRALPKEALPAINTIEDGALPDVTAGSTYADEIYMLYRAGILTGNDKYGTFAPETTIDRASVAALVSRMALPDLRQELNLAKKPVAVTGVSLNQSSLSVSVGESASLKATVTPSNADEQTVTWTSSRPSVAKVSGGTVTGVAEGTATITASVGGKSATCTVTVKARAVSSTPLYEDSRVKITFVSLEPSRYDDDEAELYLDVDNKTGGKITVQADAVSLNGYCFNNLVMSDDVSANSIGTVNVTIQNYDDSLVNLSAVETIGGQFRIITDSPRDISTILFDARNIYTGQTDNTIPSAGGREKLYSDANVEFYFGYAENYPYSSSGDRIEVYLLVRNKSSKTLLIQNDTIIIDRRSYNNTIVSDPILPHSMGYIDVSVEDYNGISPSSITTVGGDFRIIDDNGSSKTYTATMGSSGSGSGWDDEEVRPDPTPDPEPTPDPDPTPTPEPDYGYEMYSGFSGIPSFDQFTSSGRVTMTNKTNVKSYMYASATQAELTAYKQALQECGFTLGGSIAGMMEIYTKGTSGDDGYREVRLGTVASPSATGLSVDVTISKIKPSNEW